VTTAGQADAEAVPPWRGVNPGTPAAGSVTPERRSVQLPVASDPYQRRIVSANASRAITWPPGWTTSLKEKWHDLGLGVEQARAFRDWGWTPRTALEGAGPLNREEIAELRGYSRPIHPGSDVRTVMALHEAGVASHSNEWDAAAAAALRNLAGDAEVARRLRPGDDPALTVLAALHQVDHTPPADVALARHSDEGCACEADRFTAYLGIGPIEQGEAETVVVMHDTFDTRLKIRTGPYLAARVDDGLWLRLPDLASACWYLSGCATDQVVQVDDIGTGFRCLIAMAELTEDNTNLEAVVSGTELQWNGWTFVPGYDVPDWMVVAESGWEGDSGTPMNSGGTTYLIESRGGHYLGGDEMGWNEVGPFGTINQAREWFDNQMAEADAIDGNE